MAQWDATPFHPNSRGFDDFTAFALVTGEIITTQC